MKCHSISRHNNLDESMWPKDRSWRVFKAWFDIEHFDIIEDLVAAPLEDE